MRLPLLLRPAGKAVPTVLWPGGDAVRGLAGSVSGTFARALRRPSRAAWRMLGAVAVLAQLAVAPPGLAQGQAQGQVQASGAAARDAAALRAAFAAVAREDWTEAQAAVAGAGPLARDLAAWARLRAGGGSFAEHRAFPALRPDWPGLDDIRARGEEALPEGAPPAEVLAFFAEAPPLTGAGALRLAEALIAAGRAPEAEAALVQAWTTLGLDEESFDALMAGFAPVLAPHHAARADMLLWRGRTTDAARVIPSVAGDARALLQARLAIARQDAGMDTRLAAVPAALRDDPGLAYDRFNLRAARGDYTDAIAILAAQSTSAQALGQPWRWGNWRRILARWEMRQGRAAAAYDLATRHHLGAADGEVYADLEWLAGYIALTYLRDPDLALQHFARVETAVEGAISMGRAGYWLGRAHEARGDAAAAAAAFARGAEHQTGFYGLLAAERAGRPLDPALAGREAVPDWREGAFLRDDRGQAALLLMAAGERGAAVQFIAALGRTLDRAGLAQMGAMLTEMDEPFFTVLLGKTAAARGIVLPAIYFPLHPLARLDLPVAPELALSIARRESEFNAVVGSPVGALGLMQLMPGTAEEVAREMGLPYSRARLTADWEYNARLGARYLAGLEARFGPSPVMIAAGYNAGPGRPRTWMTERGDPRAGEVDVVDWIEHIPFAETRNYVMRVTESIPIYQARLGRAPSGPVRFTDLLNGQKPMVRPLARPGSAEVPGQVQAAPVPVARPQAAAPASPAAAQADDAAALVQSLRPVARPES